MEELELPTLVREVVPDVPRAFPPGRAVVCACNFGIKRSERRSTPAR
jgi:hypothetical protein